MLGLVAVAAAVIPVPPPASRADQAIASLSVLIDPAVPRRQRADALDHVERIGLRAMTQAEALSIVAWRTELGMKRAVWRGRLLGPAFRQGVLAPGEEFTFSQIFAGGRQATIAVRSAPQNNVTVSVIGPVSGALCAGRTRCGWQPRFTERYTVRIANDAPGPRQFVLVVD